MPASLPTSSPSGSYVFPNPANHETQIRSYTAAQPSRNQYLMARKLVNLALSYRLRTNLTLQFDVANLTNAPIEYYRGIPDQMEQTVLQGVKLNAGIQGRF